MNYEDYCDYTAELFMVSPDDLKSRNRCQSVANARHALNYALHECFQSYNQVGRFTGYDHTSIMHSKKVAKKLLKTNKIFEVRVKKLMVKVFGMGTKHEQELEEVLRKFVVETSARVLEPEFWPDEKIIRNNIIALARKAIVDADPRAVHIQAARVRYGKNSYIVRFQSADGPRGFWFKYMDMEQVAI